MGIAGSKNAGLYAAAILGASDPAVAARLAAFREAMGDRVRQADARVRERTR